MTEKERGWYIERRTGDDQYYLRCLKCKKSIWAITTTIKSYTGVEILCDRPALGERRKTWICSGCGNGMTILYSDLRKETPYQKTFSEECEEDHSGELIRAKVASLVKKAQAFAAADLKTNARSNRGWRSEEKFWSILRFLVVPNDHRFSCCSPEHVLAQWEKSVGMSRTPIVESKVDAVRLIGYFQRAVMEAKRDRSDPIIRDTNFFDEWLRDLGNNVL